MTEPMDYIRVIALLAHPILASVLIFWLWQQYSWRKKSKSLKGEERKQFELDRIKIDLKLARLR